jgi:hypothetical protein
MGKAGYANKSTLDFPTVGAKAYIFCARILRKIGFGRGFARFNRAFAPREAGFWAHSSHEGATRAAFIAIRRKALESQNRSAYSSSIATKQPKPKEPIMNAIHYFLIANLALSGLALIGFYNLRVADGANDERNNFHGTLAGVSGVAMSVALMSFVGSMFM